MLKNGGYFKDEIIGNEQDLKQEGMAVKLTINKRKKERGALYGG